MEINNRTVRIIQIPKTYPSREMWMMSEENFDLQLKENEFVVKNEIIFLDDQDVIRHHLVKKIIKAFKD